MGVKTSGGFSPRIVRPLINGWHYSISVMEVTNMEGKCFEGIGIQPKVEIPYSISTDGKQDMQLMGVLSRLSP
jgi:C-terminal processing protease CtpA/Prc